MLRMMEDMLAKEEGTLITEITLINLKTVIPMLSMMVAVVA